MGKTSFSILLAFLCLIPCREIRAYEETDVKTAPACGVCGMSREAFAYSRMVIEYDDGPTVGTCSLNCTVAILTADPDRKPRSIRVADYETRELIDAKGAFWVIGGRKEGVMTRKVGVRNPGSRRPVRRAERRDALHVRPGAEIRP